MTQHPITPPLELVSKWCYEDGEEIKSSPRWFVAVCAKAAQWGADQELEECCVYLVRCAQWEPEDVDELRDARRPKPPTLKQRAQRNLANMIKNGHLSPDLAELFTAAVEMAPDE
jgi:hypothetical protein